MRIKLDENMPTSLAGVLSDLGHDVHTVRDEGLTGHDDPTIWAASQSEHRFLITKDLDFSDTRSFVPGTHYGMLLVRLHEPARRMLIERVQAVFKTEPVDEWVGCNVVVTENRIRIRRPGQNTN